MCVLAMCLLYKLCPLSFSKYFDLQEVAKSSAEPCYPSRLPCGASPVAAAQPQNQEMGFGALLLTRLQSLFRFHHPLKC